MPVHEQVEAPMSPEYEKTLQALMQLVDQVIVAAGVAPLPERERANLAVMLAAKMFGAACGAMQAALGQPAGRSPDHEIARQVADFIVAELRKASLH